MSEETILMSNPGGVKRQLSKQQELAEVITTELNDNENNIETEKETQLQEQKESNFTEKRTSTMFTRKDKKIPCWMSLDIHLIDIILSSELFVINGWLIIFFKDENYDFENIMDSQSLEKIKKEGYMSYDDLNVSVRKKLPLKTSFLLNSADIDIKKCYLELHSEKENVWKLYFRFNASCAEHFELNRFPFDAQFLNLKIVYRIQDFYFLSECPEWITNDERYKLFKTDMPIKLTVKDSIKTQWKVEEPWIDLRANRGKEYNFHFSVIRLRVRREPAFYLINGVLPLFLVIACSFASFVMPIDEFLGDKLAYIITLLLTTAAFQYALSSDLPKTSETTLVDEYILYGYGILSFFTLEIAVVYQIHSIGYEDASSIVDYITVAIFALIWIWKSIMFVYSFYVFKHHDVDWKEVSHEEMKGWSEDMKGDSKYMGVANGQFQGTNDYN